ncbi:hypothetical protein HYDPIDRAFT_103984, partial [Hydnomerulius pinastri MD-312]
IGVEGELYISGIQLARGYLSQREPTAAAFIANPFVAGERVYKTGDVAPYRPDGNIEYYGRADRQIKLRGQRIELSEMKTPLPSSFGQCLALVILGIKSLFASAIGW